MELVGECCLCGRAISAADWSKQEVVASIGPDGALIACVSHFLEDGPDGPIYARNIQRFAAQKAELFRRFEEDCSAKRK
jgi:hypothetical protein